MRNDVYAQVTDKIIADLKKEGSDLAKAVECREHGRADHKAFAS
ncbi:hypothetical protein [Agrobacterium sp. MA01]|nr:hypothetical protein [Agrobacterium sp. MA01]